MTIEIEKINRRIKALNIPIADVIEESQIPRGIYYRMIKGQGSISNLISMNRYLDKKEKEIRLQKIESTISKLPDFIKIKYHDTLNTYIVTSELLYYKLNYSSQTRQFYITSNLNAINKYNKAEFLEETKKVFEIYDIINEEINI